MPSYLAAFRFRRPHLRPVPLAWPTRVRSQCIYIILRDLPQLFRYPLVITLVFVTGPVFFCDDDVSFKDVTLKSWVRIVSLFLYKVKSLIKINPVTFRYSKSFHPFQGSKMGKSSVDHRKNLIFVFSRLFPTTIDNFIDLSAHLQQTYIQLP